MRRSPGGRGGPRHGHGHGHAPPPHGGYAPPPPNFAPPPPSHHGRGFGHHQPRPPPMPMAPSPGAVRGPNTAALERDVVAFVNSMRASRSDVKAPPNALNMRELLQAICAQFGVSTYEELFGSQPWQLPVLRQVQIQHERVWSFVTCYMHARRINTLFECHAAFLQSEGIQHFSELGIGNSFLLTDAVQSLYHAPASIYPLTTHDVMKAFRQFETMLGHDAFASTPQQQYQQNRPPQRIDRDQFKQFISQQRRQPSAEAMGLHIDADGFGPYIAMLRRISKKEQREIHELQEEFNKGIADRVFELSKEKFSAENRQQALADLMQRTNEERAVEMARAGGSSGDSGHRGGASKKAATTLSSLSLEILNRVTDVDVYLDNVLRRKSADERFKPRLQAHAIADTDQKIRTQLTQFLLASQKSRHHARVKVVTWVLCGVLAKIHTLLQLDDKLPEAGPSKELTEAGAAKKRSNDDDDKADEEEECDCCCVGEDTCRCRCQCECHQDESEDESEPPKKAVAAGKEAPSPSTQPQSPLKRKRSRSRSDSIVATPSSEELLKALESFLTGQMASTDSPIESTEAAIKLLARADDHLRTKFGESVLGSFSLVQEVAKSLEAETAEDTGGVDERGLRQVVDSFRRGDAAGGSFHSNTSLSEEEAREFIAACVGAVRSQSAQAETQDVVRQAILRHACVQFGVDGSNKRTREWLSSLIEEMMKSVGGSVSIQRREDGSIVHFAEALKLPGTVDSILQDDTATSNELSLLDDSAAREQVIVTKTKEALATLARCPFLVDVAEWTHWRASFEPFCGSLLPFLRSHEMIRGSRHDDRVGNQSEFVCCTNSQVVRIRSSDEASASALDAVGISPEQIALELVSLFVQHRGSMDDFPRALVLLHLRAILKNVASNNEGLDDATEDVVGRFILEVLLFVPLDFASFALELLEEAASSHDVEALVIKSCRTRFERRRLQLIGASVRSKSKWMEAVDDKREDKSATRLQAPTMRVLAASTAIKTDGVDTHPATATVLNPMVDEGSSTEAETEIVRLDSSVCESFISALRRDQFGIGLEIADAATRAVLQAQHRRLERALKRLSDELYSEKTHFVLELLQNADDNTYSAGVIPRGEFILTRSGEIVFINNETGFSQANIQAICDVGASTKEHEQEEHPDSKKHSIGKKGIGFKSVFKISNLPEVHSNGFHIQFRANQDEEHGRSGLGYILPHWIEDHTRWQLANGTTFVLPMNEHSKQRQSEISSSLLAFEPSVLLFLQKIRELRLANQVTGGHMAFEKQEETVAVMDEPGNGDLTTTISVATLNAQHNETEGVSVSSTQRWFIVRRQLAVPAAFANRGQYTEIAIAIPEQSSNDDGNDDDDDASSRRPPLQPVFCYLPLRSYGFRFIIQGDFEVPSSREAISNGSDWNQWLVAQYPALLPALVDYFNREKLSLRHLLRVLPLDSDIQAPFRSIVGEISREVRQLPCFPSAKRNDQHFTASELLDTSEFIGGEDDDEIAFLLDDSDDSLLRTALNKRVLDVGLARTMPALLKAQLRIERLRASHVLRLLNHVCASSANSRDALLVLKLLNLLVKLWRHDRHRALLLQELQRIKCFPVPKSAHNHEEWTSLADVKGALFIRSLHGSSGKSKNASAATTELLVDGELSLLRDDFTTLLEDKFTETRRFFIEQLGVKELEDHDLITHHILPAMATVSATQETKWREHVQFLAGHVAIGCTKGSTACPLRSAIHKAMRVKTWKGPFTGIHAETEKVFVVLPAVAKRLEACSKWLRARVSRATSGFDIVDLESFGPELDNDAHRALWIDTCALPQLFDSGDARSQSALAQIVQWVQDEKDVSLKRAISAELARFMDATWPSTVVSASSTAGQAWWKQARWLEGSDSKFHRPSELWVTSAAVVSLFASSMVPITKIAFESSALRTDWQVKASPTTTDVLHVLERMSEQGVSAETSVEQMARLYAFLLEQSRLDSAPTSAAVIRKAFTKKPFVFVPATSDEESGRFVGVADAVWSSGGSIASLAAVALDDVYQKSLRAFFVGVCGVERKPTIVQLQHALEAQLAKGSSLSKRDWTSNVVPVLLLLTKSLQKGKLSNFETKALKKTLRSVAWIPVAPSSTGDSKSSFALASAKKTKLVFRENDDDREIQRLWLSMASDQDDNATSFQFVAIEDDEVLKELVPLLAMAGAASISDSLLSQPAEWCAWLAELGASALKENSDDTKTRRRSQKKYEKLLKRVLSVWASAHASEDKASLGSSEFAMALSTRALFPSYQSPGLQRGVDLFLNDQNEWSHEQFTGCVASSTLQVLSLFAWEFFVDNDSDASAIQTLLHEVAQIRSLQANLQREVVVLGPQSDVVDEALLGSFRRALGVAQRVVFAQHPASYARLDHTELQQLLPSIKIVQVQGDARALQLLLRVTTTDFTQRQSVSCYLDKPTKQLFMVRSSDEPLQLFDALQEVSRQCFGPKIATSVANVLYLASMQPTAEVLESWLVDTQRVPPLDARAGQTLWISGEGDAAETTARPKRTRVSDGRVDGASHQAETLEDGELEDGEEVNTAGKRAKLDHSWDPSQAPSRWAGPGPHHGSGSGPDHAQDGGYFQSAYASSAAYPPPPRGQHAPPASNSYGASPLQSLSFAGAPGASTNTLSDEEKIAIGRWGEEYVYQQLKQSYADRPEVHVDWVNGKEESGLPYDIVVKTGTSQDVEYVEVKSTKTMEKGVFEISMNELDQAAMHGSRYCIYRVFNAGNAALCRVVRMKNPISLVRQKKISLVLLMQ